MIKSALPVILATAATLFTRFALAEEPVRLHRRVQTTTPATELVRQRGVEVVRPAADRSPSSGVPVSRPVTQRVNAADLAVHTSFLAGTHESTFTDAGGRKSTLTTSIFLGSSPADTAGLGTVVQKQRKRSTTRSDGMICETKEVSVSLNDDSFLSAGYAQQADSIYPGAVYTFDNFFSGRFNPEPSARKAIRIASSASGMNGSIYEDVPDPTGSRGVTELRDAVNRLRRRVPESRAMANFSARIYQLNSSADGHIKLSAGASAYGASLGFGHQLRWESDHRYLLVDATQEMFTISTQVPEGGAFVDDVAALPSPLMMIGTVTYGHRALVLIDSTLRDEDSASQFSATYDAIAANANFNLQTLMSTLSEETTIRMYFVGGSNPGFLEVDRAALLQRLNDYFRSATTGNAQPIRYQFRDMSNTVIASRSATDYFPVRHCVPDSSQRDIHVTVTLESIANESNPGEEIKLGISQYLYAYGPDGAPVPDQSHQTPQIICWWEGGGPGCDGPSTFRGRISNLGNHGRSYVMKQGDLLAGAGVDVGPDYLAMYRTSFGGKTNSVRNDARREALGDTIRQALLESTPKRHTFYMNLEGRRFAITYLVQARAMARR